ncbi:MAG: SurA N-terminal domain-containing protein [Patescibacteria group bacterium]|nr:SurA N-terminal domain-containing protein [Patescibacteria group bacterium]
MSQKNKLIILFVALGAVIVLAAAGGLLTYEVYYKVNDSAVVRSVAGLFGLPAAKVGSRQVSYARFLMTRDAVKRFVNSEAGKEVGATMPPENALNKNILERLVRQEMIQEIADQKKVTVSDEDVKAIFADVVKAAASSTTPDISQYLWNNYGWNEDNFRKEVLKPALLEQKLANEMAKEKQGDQNALETELAARALKPDVIYYLKF